MSDDRSGEQRLAKSERTDVLASPAPWGHAPRFQPLAFVGQGAMGVVYRVFDTETESEVALKTFRSPSAEQLYRLKHEFRVLADAVHPNLVELYELVVADDASFFTMEFVDGVDFIAHVRPGGQLDMGRLAAATAQLVAGVDALHAAPLLHCDLKPTNVLVASDGRLVLLDFGVALAFGFDTPEHYARGGRGTIGYMAPEVLFAEPATPASDWYSVGAMLYEAITGRLPFGDSPLLGERRHTAPPPVRRWEPSVSEEWNRAVAALLAPDPSARGAGREALRALLGAGATSIAAQRQPAFVGRGAELAQLHDVFADTAIGSSAMVHVAGPSGIGKSELLRRFAAQLHEAGADGGTPPLVLSGRCHPHELVPFNGFDRVIDGLSRALITRDRPMPSLHGDDARALVRLFPVLERVPSGASQANDDDPADGFVEPQQLRRRGFRALRTVLAEIAAHEPVILWIDDLQWSDADSLALLRELLQTPIPRLMVVLSYRSEDAAIGPLLGKLPPGARIADARLIELPPLAIDEITALMRAVAGADDPSEQQLARIAADTGGNPFLVCELARSRRGAAAFDRMGDVVADRVATLPAAARTLLELVCVAGSPLPRHVALEAAGLGNRGRPLVGNLEKRSLLRTSALTDQFLIEVYHDRIREALLGRLPEESTRTRHAALADVLEEQAEPDAEALFRHHFGAGRRKRAAHWAVEAADRSADALAFERAADLYGEALALADGSEARWRLLEKQATVLANAGRALDAARTFQAAGRDLAAHDPSTPHALELRQQAATHFLQTGHLEEGIAATREVLSEVGIRYPRSDARALLTSITQRTRLWWRGLRFRPHLGEVPDPVRRRLDACWGAAISLTIVDQAAADGLGVRCLIEGLDAGDPTRTSRALGMEAAKTAQIGGRFMQRRCRRLLEMMAEIVREHGGPYERAHLRTVSGIVAFQWARWRAAFEDLSEAADILRRHCIGVNWELVTTETFRLGALAQLGELGRLGELLPNALGSAADRGDRYAVLLLRSGVLNLAWLAQDRPEEALHLTEQAMAAWPATERYQVQHYVYLIAATQADLYRNDPWSAFLRLQAAWPKLRGALLLALESPRVELCNLRARAALAAATSNPNDLPPAAVPPDSAWPRERLLALAGRDAKQLAADTNVPSALPFSSAIRAGIALAYERDTDAREILSASASQFDAVEMSNYAAAVRYRRGQIVAGSHGADDCAAARARLVTNGVQSPERMLRVYTPVGGTRFL